MTKTFTFLIVDDDPNEHRKATEAAERASRRDGVIINLKIATDYHEAKLLIDSSIDHFDAAIIDYQLSENPGAYNGIDIVDYIMKISPDFLMLAMSSSYMMNIAMTEAGCNQDYLNRTAERVKRFDFALRFLIEHLTKGG